MTIPARKLERLYVTSPVRRYLHQPLVTRWFSRSIPERRSVKNILEIGSGSGAGVLALAKVFPDAFIQGMEVDSAMGKIARRRVMTAGVNAAVEIGPFGADDYRPEAHANTYDLIVSYGCLHHIPDWQGALKHIHAALKPNGYFCAEEYYAPLLENMLFKCIGGTHPKNRFTHQQLLTAMEAAGFTLVNHRNRTKYAGLIAVQR